MNSSSDSSDGFEIVDIINKNSKHCENQRLQDNINHSLNASLNSALRQNIGVPRHDDLTETAYLEENDESYELRRQRKRTHFDLEIENIPVLKKVNPKEIYMSENQVVVLSSSEVDEKYDRSVSRLSHNTSELMIIEEKTHNDKLNNNAKALDSLEAFFNDIDSFDENFNLTKPTRPEKANKSQGLFLSSDGNECSALNNSFSMNNIQKSSQLNEANSNDELILRTENSLFKTVDDSALISDCDSLNSLQNKEYKIQQGLSQDNEFNSDLSPGISSYVFEDRGNNHSISLIAIDTDSDKEGSILEKNDNVDECSISDWMVRQHPKYLATIRLSSEDLDKQLRSLKKNKDTRQKYAFANKVKKIFKTDIVYQELFLTTNMDFLLKTDDQSFFYMSNVDMSIKKGDQSLLRPSIADLVAQIDGLKYATFTRRLTSVFELNSSIYLPISLLLENGNSSNKRQKLDFVDVEMAECTLLLDCQLFYEIFYFKERESKKKLLEQFFADNKRILLILTSTSKFITNLKKWENLKQMDKFNTISNNNASKKKKPKIPEQYENLSATDVQTAILQVQLTYKTHIAVQQIETELQFINDWFINFLKTILRARYTESKEQQDIISSLNLNAATGLQTPFQVFLMSLNGVTKNNIDEISHILGNDFNTMRKVVLEMTNNDNHNGVQRKIMQLMDKFIKSSKIDDVL
ncbi:hypothetical protein QEN19_003773 [Hanseniaspora menglaensis]